MDRAQRAGVSRRTIDAIEGGALDPSPRSPFVSPGSFDPQIEEIALDD